MPPRNLHTVYRPGRSAVALVLVFAQAVAAFGFPVVRSRTVGLHGSCGGGLCGCVSPCDKNAGCCCSPADLAPAPPPPVPSDACAKCGGPPEACCCTEPDDEPDPPKCPKCLAREAASRKPHQEHSPVTAAPAPEVKWVAGWQARQCRGEGPLGLFVELPLVSPEPPAQLLSAPAPTDLVRLADSAAASHVSVPLDPPPRCG